MGTVETEITLKNCVDLGNARDGRIKPEEVRTITVTAIADTGAMYPVITEEMREQLGLAIDEERGAHIANGQTVTCFITAPVQITWKDRHINISAMVIPGAKRVLLGVLALEAMDLMIHPKTQEVVGVHGDHVEFLAL